MKIREFLGGQPHFEDKENFLKPSFPMKKAFLVPISTSTNRVLRICRQVKCLGGAAPHTPYVYAPEHESIKLIEYTLLITYFKGPTDLVRYIRSTL